MVHSNHQQYDRLIKIGQHVPQEVLDEMHKWNQVDERVENKFKELKLELATEFKQLLGISDDEEKI